ncbi:TetR/AcrR family transcriptional regulator [Tsukamurella soli]|uniref:TetR/AcrR family transcriptional regulator n=1 Tax=Tsukamurella soli TaxID=644556 RepID=A0ABP8JD14_9ACTN
MPEARGDARTKMVEAAVVVLARSGYQGASFSAVLTESGAPRGSIYHHFPGGKDELVEAALELQTARVIAMLEAMHGIPPRQVAERFLEAWHRTLIGADFAAGCSLLAVATSAGPALQATAGRLFGDWMGALTRALTVGGAPADAAAEFAADLLAASEGAVAICRAQRSTAVLDALRGRLVREAEALAG